MTALNAFAFSALLYIVPMMVMKAYRTIQPDYYVPGTYTFNPGMQVILNASDYAANLGVLLFVAGCVLWAAGKK